jgi:hypothetical protein
MGTRQTLGSWYHGLFHVAQATMHDRWVKWLRLIAFLAASSIATQVVLYGVLGDIGFRGLLPSTTITFLVASAVWLVAYPTMWLRMLVVMAEMEAKKECEAVLHEIEKLHPHHHRPNAAPSEVPPPS